jgi:hypothetical protein
LDAPPVGVDPRRDGMTKTLKNVKVARTVYECTVRSGMPRYRSKYSKKTFDQWVWVVLLVLRQYERKDYRSFIDFLEVAVPVTEYLELKRIPHYTSLQKAAARLDSIWLRRIIARFTKERDSEETKLIGIDSTGYRLDHASKYYQTRLTYMGKKRDKYRKYLKSTISVDLDTQLIIGYKQRRGPANDNRDFPNVVRKTHKEVKASIYIADRGYDSERNHRLVREDLNAYSIIPPRNQNVPIYRTRGRYRKEMKRGYDKKTYSQRVKVETVNSVVKRKMGENIYSKKVSTQNRELELRYIAYNAKRVVNIDLHFLFCVRISTKL